MKKYIILEILLLVFAFVSCIEHNIKYTRLTIEINDSSVTDASYNKLTEVLTYRLNSIGVGDVLIKKLTANSLLVEYPTISNNYVIKQLIQQQGKLEFSLIPETDFALSVIQKVDLVLANLIAAENQFIDSILNKENLNESSDLDALQQIKEYAKKKRFNKDHPFLSIALLDPQGRSADLYVEADDRRKIELILNQADIQKVIPNNVEFKFSAITQTDASGNEYDILYLVNKKPELTGDIITDAIAGIDPNTDAPIVTITMNSKGATEWARITGSNIYRRIAIIIDEAIYAAPVVKSKIPSGRTQIDGIIKREEAENLAMILKSGMLPHPLTIIKEEIINKLNR